MTALHAYSHSFNDIVSWLQETGKSNPLWIISKSAYTKYNLENKITQFNNVIKKNKTNTDIAIILWNQENPSFEQLSFQIKPYLKQASDIDVLIAIGGGSAIDAAKFFSLALAHQQVDSSLLNIKNTTPLPAIKTIIAVPTTCGTGSEITPFLVCYQDAIKYSIEHPSIRPQCAILDPELLTKLPRHVFFYSIFDALTQAIESIWSCQSTTHSIQYAEQAIKRILDVYSQICEQFSQEHQSIKETSIDSNTLLHLQKAAYESGQAIALTRTTAAHAISYGLTTHLKIPHGYAVFLTLPHVMRLLNTANQEDCQDPKGFEHLKGKISIICKRFNVNDLQQLSSIIEHFLLQANFGLAIKNVSVDTITLCQSVNWQRMHNHPQILSTQHIQNIYQQLIPSNMAT